MSTGAGNAGFGEFAAAGTTQSPVVSVLRAQHGDHSSPRIFPWSLEGVTGPRVGSERWGSAKLSLQEPSGKHPRAILHILAAWQQSKSSWEQFEKRLEVKRVWKPGVRAELCFTHSVVVGIKHQNLMKY